MTCNFNFDCANCSYSTVTPTAFERMKYMLIKDYMYDDWIEEVREPKLIETKGHHNPCPLCCGTPSLQEQTVYHGRGNHRGDCIWLYLRNVICTKCQLQTRKILYAHEYDDSDTVYPAKIHASDSDIWKDWNVLTQKYIIFCDASPKEEK